ncbi:DUF2867 domain-containing protein [Dactylosporangium aurantiacum]|uniref:DUF2867 domain-containing protein n=1 Tax=Dactylosporangium aurantiacum TaxID=35754 RepID=A0A9Q9MEQ6_9ACTN|nr:DUF2867 domain-containing protein [Dactylosporangium aurantiacum]MDG6105195.1 DUF2867 domain-containing protein [Dactylosporangium aurantiacum]UWZ51715.1 DUF2867 domain-containing protein [Dactylosporangium aurantiacum]
MSAERAVFLPRDLVGYGYRAAVWPFHAVVFGSMVRNIPRTADGVMRLPGHHRANAA